MCTVLAKSTHVGSELRQGGTGVTDLYTHLCTSLLCTHTHTYCTHTHTPVRKPIEGQKSI